MSDSFDPLVLNDNIDTNSASALLEGTLITLLNSIQ